MAGATTPAPAVSLATRTPVTTPSSSLTTSAPLAPASTSCSDTNAVQPTQPDRTNSKFSRFSADLKRVCSKIEIWILYMTIVGLAIALLGLPYMLRSTKDSDKSLALARWTAAKDFWEYCTAQNKTAVGPMTPECTRVLADALPAPPLRKRGDQSSERSPLVQARQVTAFCAASTIAACFGLLIACIGLTARSTLFLPKRPSAQRVRTGYTLERFSSVSTFTEPTSPIPVALPRLSICSSAVTPRCLVTTELRYRVKSYQCSEITDQGNGEWEPAGHSMRDGEAQSLQGDNLDNQRALIPLPDSDDSDTDVVEKSADKRRRGLAKKTRDSLDLFRQFRQAVLEDEGASYVDVDSARSDRDDDHLGSSSQRSHLPDAARTGEVQWANGRSPTGGRLPPPVPPPRVKMPAPRPQARASKASDEQHGREDSSVREVEPQPRQEPSRPTSSLQELPAPVPLPRAQAPSKRPWKQFQRLWKPKPQKRTADGRGNNDLTTPSMGPGHGTSKAAFVRDRYDSLDHGGT